MLLVYLLIVEVHCFQLALICIYLNLLVLTAYELF